MCSSLESGNRKWETNKCINVQQKGHLTSSIFTRAFNISASQRYSRRRHYLRQTATAWFKKNISIGLNEGSKSTWRGGQTWKQRTQKTGKNTDKQKWKRQNSYRITGAAGINVSHSGSSDSSFSLPPTAEQERRLFHSLVRRRHRVVDQNHRCNLARDENKTLSLSGWFLERLCDQSS